MMVVLSQRMDDASAFPQKVHTSGRERLLIHLGSITGVGVTQCIRPSPDDHKMLLPQSPWFHSLLVLIPTNGPPGPSQDEDDESITSMHRLPSPLPAAAAACIIPYNTADMGLD